MEKSNIITVGYWSTKGLGAVCRMVVLYSGYSLKAKNYKLQPVSKDNNLTYDGSEWHDSDKIDLKKRNSLINLPYMELVNSSGDELLISQSNACLSFLGRKFNMFGKNEVEVSKCEQLLLETNDLRSVISSFAYTHYKNKDLEKEAAKEELLKYYNFVTKKKKKNIFNELGYPNISKFYNNFINLPKMQKYLNSIFYTFPYTNKSARFGSGINGNTWIHDTQIDKTPEEVIIN